MAKAAKTRFNSIQDQLKNSDKADRLLISLNRICGQKNQFYKPTKELAGKIYGLAENKSPKSILIVGDPTLLTIDERFKNAAAEITLALVSDRVPEDKFDLAVRRISKYCEAYNIKRIVRFEDLIGEDN